MGGFPLTRRNFDDKIKKPHWGGALPRRWQAVGTSWKGGVAYGDIFRSDPDWYFDRRHLLSGFPDKQKEMTAPQPRTVISFWIDILGWLPAAAPLLIILTACTKKSSEKRKATNTEEPPNRAAFVIYQDSQDAKTSAVWDWAECVNASDAP